MPGYCVLSIKKYHTTVQVHAQQEHNKREIPLPNVDKAKSVFNRELVSTNGLSYNEALRNRLYESECETGERAVRRRDNVIAIEIVTSFSHDAQVDVDAWAEANVRWMKDTFGEENVISSTLHLDESTPHIHTEVVPLDEKGHLNAKSFLGGKGAMMQLHSSYAEAMAPFGLRRGVKKSKSKKRDLEDFYDSVNTAVSTPPPPPMPGETPEEYLERIGDYLKSLRLAVLNEEMKAQRFEELAETRVAEATERYGAAIALHDALVEHLGSQAAAVQRLRDYAVIERVVPRGAMDKIVSRLKSGGGSAPQPLEKQNTGGLVRVTVDDKEQ